jgi:streptogramin lyase
LAEEAPGRIWYTATDAGGIGFLEVMTDTHESIVRYRTEFYGFGENSLPYDLVYDRGFIWFTLRGLRALGKIDVATREIEVFTLLTVGAAPTGIDADNVGRLWIAQNNGRISRFDPATETFTEFILPDTLTQAPRIEEIVYQNERNIWFTMPDAQRVVTYNSVSDQFFPYPTEFVPMGLSIDPGGGVWITASGSSSVGRFTISTNSIVVWLDAPTPDSGPIGIMTYADELGILQLWLTESKSGGLGRLQIRGNFHIVNSEKLGPNRPAGSTTGIIRTSDGHIWVADTGLNILYELTEPFIHRVYLTTVANQQTFQH